MGHGKCNGICIRFLSSLRRIRPHSGNNGGDKTYDHKTYDMRVTKNVGSLPASCTFTPEDYLKCSECGIFLHNSLHFRDNYIYPAPFKCPCCNCQLSNRHITKRKKIYI